MTVPSTRVTPSGTPCRRTLYPRPPLPRPDFPTPVLQVVWVGGNLLTVGFCDVLVNDLLNIKRAVETPDVTIYSKF